MCVCVLSRLRLSAAPGTCSPPGSSAHGTFQAKILELGAVSCSKGSSWPRDRTPKAIILNERIKVTDFFFKRMLNVRLSGDSRVPEDTSGRWKGHKGREERGSSSSPFEETSCERINRSILKFLKFISAKVDSNRAARERKWPGAHRGQEPGRLPRSRQRPSTGPAHSPALRPEVVTCEWPPSAFCLNLEACAGWGFGLHPQATKAWELPQPNHL